MAKSIGLPLCLALAAALTGCASLRPHNPPPPQAEALVQIPGMPGVRTWGDEFSPVFQQDMIDFNLAFIPDEMDTANRSDEFDNRVMNVLFETGYKLARHGYRWQKQPPGFTLMQPDGTDPPAPVGLKIPSTP